MKVDNNVIIYEAEEYINNNLTVKETAIVLSVSKRTLQLHFKRLKQIDKNLYDKVRAKQEQNQQAGRIKGGQTGKSHSHITSEQAEYMASEIIKRSITYREAEEEFGIPKSTIYEVLHSDLVNEELKSKLDTLAEANNRDMTTEDLLRRKSK